MVGSPFLSVGKRQRWFHEAGERKMRISQIYDETEKEIITKETLLVPLLLEEAQSTGRKKKLPVCRVVKRSQRGEI